MTSNTNGGPSSADKRALLAQRLARKVSESETLPLAPAQEWLWFLEQLTPGTAQYNIPAAVRLTGPLDATALEWGLNEIIRRHAPLRTTFVVGDGGLPVQQVGQPWTLTLPLDDLSALPLDDARAEAVRLAEAESGRPFDLAAGPLLRCRLMRVAPAEHLLVLVVHHIISDLWSMGVMYEELGALYGAFRNGQPSPLEPLADNYPAYAARQRELVTGPAMAEHLDYFRQKLGGTLPVLQLPADKPRPAVQSVTGGLCSHHLPVDMTGAVGKLANRAGVTPYMVLLAAFKALLYRYTGQTDIITGSPLANRQTPEAEQLVGFFSNTLVLRTDLSGEPTFLDLLSRVRETCLGAYAHQEMDFTRLIDALQPARALGTSPLFQVMFTLANAAEEPAFLDLKVSSVPLHTATAKFDLTLTVAETSEGVLVCQYEYNADLFEPETVQRLAGHYRELLAGAIANPERKLDDLPLLTDSERAELAIWNDTAAPYPKELPVHRLIEARVAAAPDHTAVICGAERLTYGELNRRANRLARYLRALGVGPDVLVGLCMERSAAMLVALLAIWKAGGAYVPLDPTYPRDRLTYMLEDSGAPVLLTQESLLSVAEGVSGVRIVCVDRDRAEYADREETDFDGGADAGHLAYVIYTSGSTGRPKGVALEHGTVVNFLTAMRETPGLTSTDTLLAVTSISFDIHVLELYLPLIAGATVVLASRADALDGAQLSELMNRHGVTVMQATPATWRLLLEMGWRPGRLKMLVGGEALPRQLADQLLAGDGELWNMYGPTEATVWCTVWKVEPGTGPILIGRPIANLLALVVDRRMEPVPVGIAGELYIGGEGLARGYLNRPELTAERFVASPWGRVYQTGDLVRRRADGAIEFLGRADFQVKVRGFRIELGEVEAVLERHPAIAQAVVAACEIGGETELVAYYAVRGQAPSVPDLRAWLKEKLPEYMVPTRFVTVETFPLTPNGKVNRKALPAPVTAEPEPPAPVGGAAAGPAVQAPAPVPAQAEGDLERTIIAIWKAVLRVERVGLNDNFFDIGGHSLRLVQVFGRLKQAVSCPLDLLELFQYPTVATLARFIRSKQGDVLKPAVPAAPSAAPTPAAPGPTAPAPATPHVEPALTAAAGGRVDIAVIGMSGRFPGAGDIEQFWQNLRNGTSGLTRVTREEMLANGEDPALLDLPNYVPVKGVLEGADLFDAGFFGITPREAQGLDPQQRVFLESCWAALEHAGYDTERYPGRIGLWAGACFNSYLLTNLMPNRAFMESVGMYQIFLSNDKDFIATRTAYKLNLRGPAMAVGTACSTSLVAVHQACQALRLGECEMALAGAASVSTPLQEGYLYQEGMILSPDGVCRPFDADAGGTVLGNGVAAVVLKRLDDALRDGDTVYAVIRGTAVNNDGSVKIGFTAPSAEGQSRVIRDALRAAAVPAESVTYVEAHGTGTALGDPIEVAGLTQAYREDGAKANGYCALGSVKSNIGHLDAAAGIAGLIKTVQALRYGELPPSLNFKAPNPKIDFAATPFVVNAALRPWETGGQPRRAGVSSLGIGGTNAHAVLEEAPPQPAGSESRPAQLLLLSARSPEALDRATDNLASYLQENMEQPLADVAYTLATGRRAFAHRRMLVCQSGADAARTLTPDDETGRVVTGKGDGLRPVAFLFPGQGAQYVGMLEGLYQKEPIFRDAFDRCAALLKTLDLKRRVLAGPANELGQTATTQPALFAVEYAMAQLWLSWGIRPRAMIGHSLGEYVAATLSGVMSLEDALTLVAARGRLMQSMAPGAMLSVPMSEADLLPMLPPTLSVAAVNGRAATVVAGPAAAVAALAEALNAQGVEGRKLQTSHAFHSAMMEPMLAEYEALVAKVTLRAPAIPFVSNLTGTWITDAEATSPAYWATHIRQPVRFADGLKTLFADPDLALLEVGPGQTLSTLARQHPDRGAGRVIITSGRRVQDQADDQAVMLGALGRLWLAGVEVGWDGFWAGQRRRRVALPTYPFERQRHWVEVPQHQPQALLEVAATTMAAAPPTPAPAASSAENAPEGELEEAVAAIWQEVLGVAKVGRFDSFFELGGDSLMASRVITRLREIFPVAVPLSALFDSPTLTALATRVEDMLIEELQSVGPDEAEE